MTLTLPIVYPKLPHMKCDRGCGDCCGPVTCNAAEYEAVVRYAAEHGVEPRRQGITCPYFQDGACAVYPVRPWVCRMMGHAERLVCSRGYNVLVPANRERKLLAEYLSHGEPASWLHAAVYTEAEMLGILSEKLESPAPSPTGGDK